MNDNNHNLLEVASALDSSTTDSISSTSSSLSSLTSSSLFDSSLDTFSNKNIRNKPINYDNRECNNFSFNNVLASTNHPYTLNNKSIYTSYFYTNTATILNKFVMSYEEQLHKAITKGNYELCNELIIKNCNINKSFNKKYPICLACEHNYYEIAELLIKVSFLKFLI